MSSEAIRLRRDVLQLSSRMLVVVAAAVAAGVLVNLPSLVSVNPRAAVRAICLIMAAALGMGTFAVAAVTLLVLRRRRPDPTAELLARYYRQLLDESSLNPARRAS